MNSADFELLTNELNTDPTFNLIGKVGDDKDIRLVEAPSELIDAIIAGIEKETNV